MCAGGWVLNIDFEVNAAYVDFEVNSDRRGLWRGLQ